MTDLQKYINSGIIEAYVTGLATPAEVTEVEAYAAAYPAVKIAIDDFSEAFEIHALENAVTPDPLVKPMVMASIDYMSRLSAGEKPSFPPVLNEKSAVADYDEWVLKADMVCKEPGENIYAKIIGHTPEVTTAIVWIKEMAPQEIHHNEFERFLVIQGSCNIMVESAVYALHAGDYFEIPLHTAHSVKVTSESVCKVLLQRVAA